MKKYLYDVYIKVTESSNIYIGFVTKDTPISRLNKDQWTSIAPLYFCQGDLRFSVTHGKQNLKDHMQKYYKLPYDYVNVNWIDYFCQLMDLNPKTVHKVTDPLVAEFLFNFFHEKGVYTDLKDFKCHNIIQCIDIDDKFFENNNKCKDKNKDKTENFVKEILPLNKELSKNIYILI